MTKDNREVLAAQVQFVGEHEREHIEAASILLDLADFLGETAGEFTDKALAEIANAYLQGIADAEGRSTKDARQAQRMLMPLIPAINRVR